MFDSQKNHPNGLIQALLAGAIVASVAFTAGCSGAGEGISAESVAAAAQAVAPKSPAQEATEADIRAQEVAYHRMSVTQQANYVLRAAQGLLTGERAYVQAHLQEPSSLEEVMTYTSLEDAAGNFWLPAVDYSLSITTVRLAITSKAVCDEIERHPESGATCAPDPDPEQRNLYAVTFGLQDQ